MPVRFVSACTNPLMGQTARGIISAPLTLSVILLSVVAWVWLRNQPASQRKPAILKLVLIAGVTMVALLAVKGRLHFVFALLALLFSLLRYCREQDEDSASAGGL